MLLRMTYPVMLGGMAGWVPVLVAGPLPPTAYWSLLDWNTPRPRCCVPAPLPGPQTPAMVTMAGAAEAPAAVAVPDQAAGPEGGTFGVETEMDRGPDQGAREPRPVPRSPNCILVRISSAVPPRISRRSAGKIETGTHGQKS